VTGYNAIYNLTVKGFTIYMRYSNNGALNADIANQYKFRLRYTI
jgi:hypothetical protein